MFKKFVLFFFIYKVIVNVNFEPKNYVIINKKYRANETTSKIKFRIMSVLFGYFVIK